MFLFFSRKMSHILAPFQLLELNVISAQDLAPVTRNMRTYAVAWVHPDRKLSTRVDTQGHTNPTWNDKFVFRVDEEFLYADTSAIMIEIYALHWFKDVHVGTVRVLVGNLIPPPSRPFHNNRAPLGMRFVALQVRRASGRPQGILNIGVAVLDSSMRSMPLYTLNSSAVGYRHLMGEKDAYDSHNHLSPHVFGDNNKAAANNAAAATTTVAKPELRRTKSDTSSMMGSEAVVARRTIANKGKANSVISESVVSGSSLASESQKRKNKKKGKRRSRGNSSVVSGGYEGKVKSGKSSSMLSGSLPWKLKKNRQNNAGSALSGSDVMHVQEPAPPFEHNKEEHNIVEENHMEQNHMEEHNMQHINVEHNNMEENNVVEDINNYDNNNNEAMYVDQHDKDDVASSVNTVSEAVTSDINNNLEHGHGHGHVIHYEAVAASPKPQFHGSPVPPPPQYHRSPAPQFHSSPAPQFHSSPAPKFRNSPAPKYLSSPAVAPQYKNSPKPQFINSPKPQYMNSPKPKFQNSPKPQFQNSPKPQFRNSPAPQLRNSPAPQYRASPTVSKFNPVVSNRATPMQPFGYTPRFEYTTPRRSNLGNMGPPVVTESELGPSASEVAAAMARKPAVDEGENSTVGGWSLDESVEGLQSKLERWRTELPPVIDRGEFSSFPTSSTKTTSRHTRRHTDNGLFSCFSSICGVECSIVCGGDNKGKKNPRRRTPSADGASFL